MYKWNHKRTAFFGVLFLAIIVLSACGSNSKSQLVEGKTNVVTSFYPLYFMAKHIGGEKVNVINLIPTGVEPHDWTPKSRDIETASKADLLLYHGIGLEGWIDNFLDGLSKDSKLVTAEMSMGIKLIEGNLDEHGHEEEGHNEEEHEDHADHLHDVDPHTWVSPKSALVLAENVKNSLIAIDSAHQSEYEANYAVLKERLVALDAKFTAELSQTSRKDIVVSHQAFGYLARDYGLRQLAIMGVSADEEPRPQDMLNIAKFVKEHGVKYIFFEELISDELAQTIASEADAETLVLNPAEGLTPDQEKQGEDYISLMEKNLQNLLQALQ